MDNIDILTLEEAAEYLKISKNQLYKLARAGKIPAKKVGDLWRFSKRQLKEWIAIGGTRNSCKGGEEMKSKKISRKRTNVYPDRFYEMDQIALAIIAANEDGVTLSDSKPLMIVDDLYPGKKDGVVTVVLLSDKNKVKARFNVPRNHLKKIPLTPGVYCTN